MIETSLLMTDMQVYNEDDQEKMCGNGELETSVGTHVQLNTLKKNVCECV